MSSTNSWNKFQLWFVSIVNLLHTDSVQFSSTAVWKKPEKILKHMHLLLPLLRIANNSELWQQMTFKPQQIFSSSQGKQERCYSELFTAQYFWQLYQQLPKDEQGNVPKLIILIPEQDKTAL